MGGKWRLTSEYIEWISLSDLVLAGKFLVLKIGVIWLFPVSWAVLSLVIDDYFSVILPLSAFPSVFEQTCTICSVCIICVCVVGICLKPSAGVVTGTCKGLPSFVSTGCYLVQGLVMPLRQCYSLGSLMKIHQKSTNTQALEKWLPTMLSLFDRWFNYFFADQFLAWYLRLFWLYRSKRSK